MTALSEDKVEELTDVDLDLLKNGAATIASIKVELSDIRQQIKALKKQDEKDWVNKAELKIIGFTDGAIEDFLGGPSKYVNTRGAYGTLTNHAYLKERVAKAR